MNKVEGKRFIHSLQLQNFLSYSSENEAVELKPLNVLIGPNASGKSNFIEAIGLLQALPTDMPAPIRRGGGISDFLWKGAKDPIARIEAILDSAKSTMPLRYKLGLTVVRDRLELVDEVIEDEHKRVDSVKDVYFYYRYLNGNPVLNFSHNISVGNKPTISHRNLRREDLIPDQSVLSQRKDPDLYPELAYLSDQFSKIGLYREWNIGRDSEARMPQKTDLPEHPLLEDGSNLGLILSSLQHQLGSRKIIERLKKFYDLAEELTIKISGGTVQIFIREEGLIQPIPATRLSDGTLRYLFLLALLCDPNPPPLLCIEEPEIGFHPDILPIIAEMLVEASHRTQLIITTHSDALVSGIPPESVLVCSRDQRGSHLHRLDSNQLETWLENYSLGDLWRMGELGGTR